MSSPVLSKLNTHLESNSYLAGFSPSHIDFQISDEILKSNLKPDPQSLPNLTRWLKHIQSFSAEEQSNFRPSSTGQLLASDKDKLDKMVGDICCQPFALCMQITVPKMFEKTIMTLLNLTLIVIFKVP